MYKRGNVIVVLHWGYAEFSCFVLPDQLARLAMKIDSVEVANSTKPQIKLFKYNIDNLIREQNRNRNGESTLAQN